MASGAATFRVTPDVLKVKSGEAKSDIQKMKNIVEKMDTIVNRTSTYWQGEGGDAHRKGYDSLKKEIIFWLMRLQEHPKDLLEMAGVYDEVEAAVTESSNSLPVDIIF